MNGDSSNLYMDWGTETMACRPFFSVLLMDSQSCRLYLEYIWVCLKTYTNYWNTTKMAILKQAMIRIYTRQYDICVSKQYPTKYVYE